MKNISFIVLTFGFFSSIVVARPIDLSSDEPLSRAEQLEQRLCYERPNSVMAQCLAGNGSEPKDCRKQSYSILRSFNCPKYAYMAIVETCVYEANQITHPKVNECYPEE